MLSMYAIKPFYQKLFRGLAGNWMTPNMATGFGIFFSILVGSSFLLGATVHRGFLVLVMLGLIFRMGANALDGMLAREKGLASPLGAVLNEVTDVVNDVICYAPLWFVPHISQGALTTFLILILFAEFSGLLGQAVNGKRRYDGPLGGKTDRAMGMGVATLLWLIRPDWIVFNGWVFGLLSVFVALTAVNRLRKILEAPQI